MSNFIIGAASSSFHTKREEELRSYSFPISISPSLRFLSVFFISLNPTFFPSRIFSFWLRIWYWWQIFIADITDWYSWQKFKTDKNLVLMTIIHNINSRRASRLFGPSITSSLSPSALLFWCEKKYEKKITEKTPSTHRWKRKGEGKTDWSY